MTRPWHDTAVSPLVLFAALAVAAAPVLGACADPHGEEAPWLTRGQAELRPVTSFKVAPRTDVLREDEIYPCSECHDSDQEPDPNERKLEDDHETIEVEHGGERFWCLECHHTEDRDFLAGGKGEKISFDEQWKLCGRCHYEAERDFLRGAHGKRLDSWKGDRVLTSCTSCHKAHSPGFAPRKPLPPPVNRPGLGQPSTEQDDHAR